ncbi:MAG: hypothetical protein WDO16_11195, partial [Bacteroidota bacterium]
MKNSILSGLLAAVLFTGCQPETSFLQKEKQTSLSDFYKSNSSPAQTFAVNNVSGGVMTTSGGAKIHFPANGFVTESGAPVSGNVDIAVKEIFTPIDMILNNMPAMSGGLPLESGGEFEVKVTKNGQRLKLASGNFLQIEIPARANVDMNGMQVFNGVKDAKGNIDWSPNSTPGNFVVGDSTLFTHSSLFCDSVNWINCDKFYNEPTVSFSVYPANAPSNDSTNVFVHLTGRNSVVKMNWTQGLSYFNSDKLLAVPSTIVGISIKNGQLYASVTPVSVQNGQSVTMDFAPYTEAQLKQKLSQLH